METLWCPKIPNPSTDWKLNPNVECRITLNKLKIKTPEYETMEFCRMLTDRSAHKEPTFSHTKDIHSNLEFVLDVLLNEILSKCEEKCGLCEKYVQQLLHHIIQAHSTSPDAQSVFKCDICGSTCSSPSMLIHHRNTHSDNRDTLTDISTSFDISTVTRTNESSGHCANHPHLPVPVSVMNFECNSMKQELSSSQSELEISYPNVLGVQHHMNHLSTIENNVKEECNDLEWEEDLQDPLLLQDLEIPSFVKYECTGVSTESEQQTMLATHDMSSNDTHTGRENFPVPSGLIRHKITESVQKPHKCDICGKFFSTSHQLTRHKSSHSGKRPHSCDVCGKCFRQRFILTRHKLTHTGERPHSCDVCGKRFLLQDHLTRHKLIHTGEKPHKCDVCGKGFLLQDHLAEHKLIHTGEKPHKCDVCGQGFNRRSNLTQHKLTHTGEKSFCCDVCGQSFYRGCDLNRHKLVHTGEKPFECNVCGKCFALQFNLTKHKRTHTGEKSFRCNECGQNFYGQPELTKHKLKHD